MLRIIQEGDTWRKIISDFPLHDFYHTYDYHIISKKNEEHPELVYFEEEDFVIAIPFLKRSIIGTPYYDYTSVYGYAGPLMKNLNDEKTLLRFKEAFLCYLKESNIISVFSRLNPFISSQDLVLQDLGTIETLGPLVYIDLQKSLDQQRIGFSKTTKRYLNKVRKDCYVVKDNTELGIKTFVQLYHETMNRVKADNYYYFDESYFKQFIQSKEYQTDLLFAKLNATDEIIAAAMMVKCNGIVQYHLSGTRTKFLKLTPLRLLIDEARIQATNEVYSFFNLGGGLGSSEDSLFYFKSSFSKDIMSFKVWKLIANEEVYYQLCNGSSGSKDPNDQEKEGFFPLYRKNK